MGRGRRLELGAATVRDPWLQSFPGVLRCGCVTLRLGLGGGYATFSGLVTLPGVDRCDELMTLDARCDARLEHVTCCSLSHR